MVRPLILVLPLIFCALSSYAYAEILSRDDLLDIQREAFLNIDPHRRENALFRSSLYSSRWARWNLHDAIHAAFKSTLTHVEHYQMRDKLIFDDNGRSPYVIIDDPSGEYFRIKPWTSRDDEGHPVPYLGSIAYDRGLNELDESRGRDYFQVMTHFNYAPPDEAPSPRLRAIEAARFRKLTPPEEQSFILYSREVRNGREALALLQLAAGKSTAAWLEVPKNLEPTFSNDGPLSWTISETHERIQENISYRYTQGRTSTQMRGFVKSKDQCKDIFRNKRRP